MPDAMYTSFGKQELNMEKAQSKRRFGLSFWAMVCLGATMLTMMLAGLLGRHRRKGADRERIMEYHSALG